VSGSATLHPDSWHLLTMLDQAPGFRALSGTLIEMTQDEVPVVVCTADLKYSNGLVAFQREFPARFFQFGVSEQNMVSAAAGLATTGVRPYVATFASFLALLCCEQIRTDIAYPCLPVRLIGHHSGITLGFYGTSHHATEDIGIMRTIAEMTVVAPADAFSLAAALRATKDLKGPVYFRIGRGREPSVYQDGVQLRVGEAIVHLIGSDLTLLATGSMVHPALAAATTLRAHGHSVGMIDIHTIKPIDIEAITKAARSSSALMTVEEHNIIGGLGGAVAEVLAGIGGAPRLHRHGIPDGYAPVGPPTHLYRHYHLDADGIVMRATAVLEEKASA
jgi:transketolase